MKIEIMVDRSMFSEDALLRACRWLVNDYFVDIDQTDNSRFIVILNSKVHGVDPNKVHAEFMNSLLEEEMRVRIEKETRTIREALVSCAFYDRIINMTVIQTAADVNGTAR